LSIKHPIMLGPMSGTSNGRLTGTVSLHGGFGVLGAAFYDKNWLETNWKSAINILVNQAGLDLQAARSRLGIGLLTFSIPSYPGVFETTLECEPGLIWLSFGDHAPYISQIRAYDREKRANRPTRIAIQVQTVAEAVKVAQEFDPDIIVAQGMEAGGHGKSESTTFCLVPQVVDALKTEKKTKPLVLAAGGIVEGRGIASALTLGADGVVMGSRFFVSKESPEPDAAKARVIQVKEGSETVRSRAWDDLRGVWPPGWNGRAIANQALKEYEEILTQDKVVREQQTSQLIKKYQERFKEKDYEYAALWTGAGAGLIHGEESVQAIIETSVKGAIETLQTNHAKIIGSRL